MGFLESLKSRSNDKEMKVISYQVKVLTAQVDELTKIVNKLDAKADSFVDASALEEVREQVSKNRQSIRTLRERFERYIRHK